MDLRIISKNRVPVPYLAFKDGKYVASGLLYPNIAEWIKRATPLTTDTITIGQSAALTVPTDAEELKHYNTWLKGIDVMKGRSDAAAASLIMDVAMEIMNFAPTIDIVKTPSAERLQKGEVKLFASIGGMTLNESGTQP